MIFRIFKGQGISPGHNNNTKGDIMECFGINDRKEVIFKKTDYFVIIIVASID